MLPHSYTTATLRLLTLLAAAGAVAACRPARPEGPTPRAAVAVIPAPVSFTLSGGPPFVVDTVTVIAVEPGDAEARRIGEWLADLIGSTRESTPRVVEEPAVAARAIALRIRPDDARLGPEGYELTVNPEGVSVVGGGPAGLFYGVQTLRQLMPPAVEHTARRPAPLEIPAAHIVDRPRFEWRGMMLDVSRHFLPPEHVKRFIDLLALYRMNRLHLHLSDDQGWRIEIRSWPNLTAHGGSGAVGGHPGGYYTQEEFADLVAYAQARFITIVPEIDMPGHTNAALASYPELNCDGVAPPLYEGIQVGFSALCVDKDVTYRFIDDVVREISALIPGPYFHIGGDEVERIPHDRYLEFISRVERIVAVHGKRIIGWGEIAPARLTPNAVVQHWRRDSVQLAVARGSRVILSPSSRVYLDMKYDAATPIGLSWAGLIDVRHAYDWEPATWLDGVPESAILGVEAPLWAETLGTVHDYEFMAFPRLLAVAELAWSPPQRREWNDFRRRLRAHWPRFQALGVNAYRSPDVW